MELHLSDLWERNHRRSLDRTDKQIVVYYSAQDTTWRMMNSAMCPHPDFYDLQLFPVMDGIEGLVDCPILRNHQPILRNMSEIEKR
ncbi:hypothetical protein WA026_004243 [Henosepilachna vigintioctopunctata]|uniref:Uncharacterized protein n=1 Tax=Henosepilachna vigintioctopunctata TaxID=420089 RepID=A0AAW1VAQ3_9CUCU